MPGSFATPRGGWPVPRSLYVHVPFCRHRCGYCNFSVIADRDDLQGRFLDAIERELATVQLPDKSAELDTVFLGGGTPTQLSADRLTRLMGLIRDKFELSTDAEITTEANPEDIDPAMLDTLCSLGINRLSLGVQSFDARKLQVLQRSHTKATAIEAITAASGRIPNVSIDLIFAAPEESLATWKEDIAIVCSLPIQHVSTYALTFEKGTEFWSQRLHGKLSEATEENEIEMYQAARREFATAGLEQYEISSFARTGSRCRHNQAYWAGRGWFAVGPGAARFVEGRREVNHRSTTTYLRKMTDHGEATAESELISLGQCARERAAFGVRQIDGINLGEIKQNTGICLTKQLSSTLQRCQTEGLIDVANQHVRLTEKRLAIRRHRCIKNSQRLIERTFKCVALNSIATTEVYLAYVCCWDANVAVNFRASIAIT